MGEKDATYYRERSTCFDECLKKANGCVFRQQRWGDNFEDNNTKVND